MLNLGTKRVEGRKLVNPLIMLGISKLKHLTVVLFVY